MSKKDIKKHEENIESEQQSDDSGQEIKELGQKLEEAENKYRRALADYQNLQKRVNEEKSEWIRAANKDLLLRILTVLDTLILANQHVQDKNLQVSIDHFLDILRVEGVTRIMTLGKTFDPATMEAIATEAGEDGAVLAETRAGFMLHDKLLRAAQVRVGKSNF